MKRLILTVTLLLASPALGQTIGPSGTSTPNVSNATGTLPVANGGTGTLNYTGAVASFPTKRVPSNTDDTSRGYSANQFWSYGGTFWYSQLTTANYANWEKQQPYSYSTCSLVTSCKGAYGVYRLVNSYAGNAFNITRASDSATLAIGFDGSGIANWSAVDAFCATTTCTVNTLYDQSGNGYDLTQSTVASQPKIADGKVGTLRAITFDGQNAQRSLSNTSLPITNRQNTSVFILASTIGAGGNSGNTFADIGTPTAKLTYFNAPVATPGAALAYNAGSGINFTMAMRASTPQLFSFVATSGTVVACQNNQCATGGTTITASAATGLLLGATTLAGYAGKYDLASFFIYDAAMTSVNQQIVQQSSYYIAGIQPQVNDNIIAIGDSITCCTSVSSGANPDQTWTGLLASQLDHPLNFYNYGLQSENLSTMITYIASWASYSYIAGANNIGIVFGGTNDLATSSSTTAANVFSNMQTACSTLHTAGYKCVVASPLARNGLFSGGQTQAGFETQRQALELLLTNATTGWTSFADGFVDLTADPTMGPAASANSTAYYIDAVHPTAPVGTSYEAAAFARGLKPLLQ